MGSGPEPGRGPDICTFATGFGHLCTTCRKDKAARSGAGSTNSCTDREKHLSLSTNLHQNTHTVTGTGPGVSESLSVCENRNGANDSAIRPLWAGNSDQGQLNRLFICTTWCKVVQESLPGVLPGAGGSRPVRDLREGKGGLPLKGGAGGAVAPAKSDCGGRGSRHRIHLFVNPSTRYMKGVGKIE